MNRSERRGFTLIELLVVMAIISVLIGLLLPAVQKVRAAAQRMKCQNNLKQLALGMHNYESSYGFIQSSIRTGETGRQGWAIFLLPFLEQGPLYSKFNLTLGWDEGTNRALVGNTISILQCPSTPDPLRRDADPTDSPPWSDEFVATGDYSTIYGLDPRLASSGLVDVIPDVRGLLPRNIKSKFAEAVDGLSNTIAFVESSGKPQIWRGGKPFGTLPTDRVNGGGWPRPANDFELKGSSNDGATFPGPCAINCTNGDNFQTYPHPIYGTLGTGEVYSFHSDGANASFGDGSVRFLRSAIPIRTFARLVTRSGGEAGTSDD